MYVNIFFTLCSLVFFLYFFLVLSEGEDNMFVGCFVFSEVVEFGWIGYDF